MGWYRVPSKDAATGSLVKIVTHVGFITLDAEEMTFEVRGGLGQKEDGRTYQSSTSILSSF